MNLAVPLFLAISGYFMALKPVNDKKEYFAFVRKQIPRVYIPMLVWSVPYVVISLLHQESFLKSIVKGLIGGYSVYYYIILIVQYYCLLSFMQRLGNSKKGVGVSILISICSILLIETLFYVCNKELPLVVYAGPFPVWIQFFVIGIYLRKKPLNHSLGIIGILTALFFALSVAESYGIMNYTGKITGMGIKSFSFLYAFCAILFLFSNPVRQLIEKYENRKSILLVTTIGKYSFGIYLIHIYIYTILQKITGGWEFNFIPVLILSILLVGLGRKIAPSFSRTYLGF